MSVAFTLRATYTSQPRGTEIRGEFARLMPQEDVETSKQEPIQLFRIDFEHRHPQHSSSTALFAVGDPEQLRRFL